MAITRVTGAQILQSPTAGAAYSWDWEGYALQRLDNGRLAAVWKTVNGATETMHVSTLDVNGVTHSSILELDSGSTSNKLQLPSIASNQSGGFFVAWEDDPAAITPLAGNTYGRAFNSAGAAVTAAAHHSTASSGGEYTPSAARLGNGNFLVTWADTLTSPAIPPSGEIMARIYSPAGVALGGEFRLNTTTAGIQLGTDLVSLGDGRTVAVWGNATFSNYSVVATELRGRFISSSGSGTGVDFQIDKIAAGSEYQDESLELLSLGNGGFVVVWEEQTSASVEEIHFQRFSSTGAKLGSEVVAESVTGASDITQLLATELANGGFAFAWRVFNDQTGAVTSSVRAFNYNGTEIGTETSLNAIAAPGLALTADLELMSNGKVMALGVTDSGIATQVFDFGDERLFGTTAADALWGKNGVHDQIYGFAGNDTIYGLGGNDIIDGGGGADRMVGGGGADVYFIDNAGDVVVEGVNLGIDKVRSTIGCTLAANVENLDLIGTANVSGTGNAAANAIVGNAGANVLAGLTGNDTLTGGAGADAFVFNTALNAASNLDRITDFSVADDTVRIDNAVFTAIMGAANTTLSAAQFRAGSAALDGDDRIIYDAQTGALYYDANGNGAGGAVQFATLAAGLALTNADFLIV